MNASKSPARLRRSKEAGGTQARLPPETEVGVAIETYFLVNDLMTRWPPTIRVFLDFKMGCIGCPIASFHSVDDACREHGIDANSFMAALRGVAG